MNTLSRKDVGKEAIEEEIIAATQRLTLSDPSVDNAAGAKACSLCGISSHTLEDQRSHVRSDLHRYNLKQRMRGRQAVSEANFEKLVGGEVFA